MHQQEEGSPGSGNPPSISIDTKGNNLFETNKALFDEKKGPIVREISSQVRFIK